MFFNKKWSLCLLFLISTIHLFAQNKQYAFRVQFSNKPTTYSLTQPLAYLSQRALDRRAHFAIAIDSSDLPVFQQYTDTVLQLTQGVFHNQSKWLNQVVILLSDSSKIAFLTPKNWVKQIDYIAYYPDGLHAKKTNASEKDKVLAKGNVFEKAKTLRDRFQLTKEDGTSFYVRFFNQEDTSKNLFQVTNQVAQAGSYLNRYDLTLLVNGLPLVQIELKRLVTSLKIKLL